MKAKGQLCSALMLVLGVNVGYAADDFVRQTDIATGVVMDVYVHGPDGIGEESGSYSAALPVGGDGARFQLFGVGLEPDETLYELADTIVGVHVPTAAITVGSEDSYAAVTRTRADKPFDATMTFGNLDAAEDAPMSSRYLYVERLCVEYAEGGDRLPVYNPDGETLRVIEAFFVQKNGELSASIMTSLKSDLDYKQRGEERIRIYALPNENLDWYPLVEKKVHIWPIADAELTGAVAGVEAAVSLHGEVLTSVPSLVMSATDLYPSSSTYVRVYKGEVNEVAAGAENLFQTVGQEYAVDSFHTIVPQTVSKVISASEWEDFASEDGIYTAEIVTVTPFNDGNAERLAYATFEIKRDNEIQVNGNLVDAE